VESCLTATRAAQPICHRVGLFGSPLSSANRKDLRGDRKDPSSQGNPSTDLVAIRQHATEASSVGKRTCVALLSPSGAVQAVILHAAWIDASREVQTLNQNRLLFKVVNGILEDLTTETIAGQAQPSPMRVLSPKQESFWVWHQSEHSTCRIT